MPKINLLITIKNNDIIDKYETKGIVTDSIIKYKEKDNTTVLFDKENKILCRNNNNINMEYLFDKKNTIGKIFINELKKEVNIDIITNKVEIINNNISIEYIINDDLFEYKIEEIVL